MDEGVNVGNPGMQDEDEEDDEEEYENEYAED
jgi:hypothetical protein